jgi:tRNA (guanine37-N1)-methyltransferase
MRFHIITIFPGIFDSYVEESILGRAIENKKVQVKFYNPRDFLPKTANNYRPVDERPYGGGPGMVMKAEPILKAVAKALSKIKDKKRTCIINFIPRAEKFTTDFAKKASKKYDDIILICGRYEGIDARVDTILKTKQLSIGDYVLTGGELPAMVVVDCISRQIPGVLGKFESLEEERISSSKVYTRPEVLTWPPKGVPKKYKVPPVLLSGDHKKIDEWKQSRT